MIVYYILSAFIGYLLGNLNLAYFIGKSRGFDIREHGSNNAGASNAVVTMGSKIGILVGIHDIAKASLAVIIATWVFPELSGLGAIAGACAIIGHIFPFYLNFKGGKGFAPFMGMVLGIDWRIFLILSLMTLLITVIYDYIAIGTFTAIVSFSIYICVIGTDIYSIIAVIVSSILIIWKHRVNIERLFKGEEIGLHRALRKRDKINKLGETDE